jgi:hypothetical protein
MIPVTDTVNQAKVDLYLRPAVVYPAWCNQTTPCTGVSRPDYTLDTNILASAKYDWIVGTDEKNNAIPAGQYWVRACISGSSNLCDLSDTPFTITAGTSTQETTVSTVVPNGGENWLKNSVQTITWNFVRKAGDIANYAVDIILKNNPQYVACPAGYSCMPVPQIQAYVAKNIPAEQQKYIWTVGNVLDNQTIWAQDYTMKICFAGTTNCAVTDSPFTISDPTQVRKAI